MSDYIWLVVWAAGVPASMFVLVLIFGMDGDEGPAIVGTSLAWPLALVIVGTGFVFLVCPAVAAEWLRERWMDRRAP